MGEPSGVARQVDTLGRIEIPVVLRESFGIRAGDLIEVFVDGGRVIIRKPSQPHLLEDVDRVDD